MVGIPEDYNQKGLIRAAINLPCIEGAVGQRKRVWEKWGRIAHLTRIGCKSCFQTMLFAVCTHVILGGAGLYKAKRQIVISCRNL